MEHFDERPATTLRPSADDLTEEIQLEVGRQERNVVIDTEMEIDMKINLISLLREHDDACSFLAD